MAATRASVNLAGFVGGVFATVFLTKAASYLTPYKLYFSFSSFLYGTRSIFRWEALTIKLLIPVIVGFLLFVGPFYWMLATQGSAFSVRTFYRYLAQQSDLTARSVGFFAALLMAWPFIVYWDILMEPTMIGFRFPFLCVYLLYFVSYAYFAGLGVSLGRLVVRDRLPKQATENLGGRLAWLEAVRTSFIGIVTSGIATYFASRLGGG
jgi:hypothetical protein